MKNTKNTHTQKALPDGRPTCVLTFDLEGWDEGDWMQPYIHTANVTKTDTDAQITERIITILAKEGHTATFFTTQLFLRRYPHLIRRLHDAGHEIGAHGPQHLRLHTYPRQDLKADLATFSADVQALTGTPPRGYRAPHFSIDPQTEWLFPLLREQGYTYDSSRFSAIGAEHGSTDTPNSPHHITTASRTILEIPVPGFPFLWTRLPFAGGLYFRALPDRITEYALTHLPHGVIPCLYLHPHELQTETPQISKGPRLKRFLKYLGTQTALPKFIWLTKRVRFVSIAQAFPDVCKP